MLWRRSHAPVSPVDAAESGGTGRHMNDTHPVYLWHATADK